MIFHYSGRHHVDSIPGADAVNIRNLRVVYDASQGDALNCTALDIPAGIRTALIGPNGAGKSTLLKTLAGLQPYNTGSVAIYGRPVRACHHRVAYLPQRGEIDWRFPITVRRFVMGGRYVHLGWLTNPQAYDDTLVVQTLQRLGLGSVADRRISDLSGGQQQRALLARAIVQEAELLLLDEPFNNVDPETRLLICTILDELQQLGRTAIVATHDLSRLSQEFDFIISLHAGAVIKHQVAELYQQTAAEQTYE
ncbi:MAG: metal ABC transporter ATP-binding protein [Chloroflexales bacterium]|nr:metal ABC transporter ATP-binding protein [Chloroflexales bacterium]